MGALGRTVLIVSITLLSLASTEAWTANAQPIQTQPPEVQDLGTPLPPARASLPPGATAEWQQAVQAELGSPELAPPELAPTELAPTAPSGLTPAWEAQGENDGDSFGFMLAEAGDVNGDGYADVIVGAGGFSSAKGKAYVFHGSATGLETASAWEATGEADSDAFGASLAGAGDVNGDGYADVIVGSQGFDGGGSDKGKVYLYLGSASGLEQAPDWSAVGENDEDEFGVSLAGAGDVNGDGYVDVLIGAWTYPSATDAPGKAYLYSGSADGLGETAFWTETGETAGDRFGGGVAGAGDVNGDGYADIVIGAFQYDGAGINRGKAYVYHGSSTGPGADPDWSMVGVNDQDYYGWRVAEAGDVNGDDYNDVLVSAYGFDGVGTERGKASLYPGSSSGLLAGAIWSTVGENDYDHFGLWVAGAGDVNGDGYSDFMVGAPEFGYAQGKAYLYYGSSPTIGTTPAWSASGENDGDYFGVACSGAGDVNGDGYADILIGATGFAGRGKAYSYLGGADTLPATAGWSATGENTLDYFGYVLNGAGDVNGDGYSDVIVGAYGFDSGRGKVYVYHGSETGLQTPAAWTAIGENAGDNFGRHVAGAGDVDGDGYADIIIGASFFGSGDSHWMGKVYVYHGSADGLEAETGWSASGENADDIFGMAVDGAGDVNGDGLADVIIGAGAYPGGSRQGKAYIYLGSPQGLETAPGWSATGENAEDAFGRAAGGAGDVNGDGFADIIIGAFKYPSGASMGKVYVYHGSPTGLNEAPAWSAVGEKDGDAFGDSVARAGDLNGDGYADVLIGADAFVDAGLSKGKAYAYLGSALGLEADPAWSAAGEGDDDLFGFPVRGAGDVNGDGYADILVGAKSNAGGGFNKGKAYLYHGSAAGPSTTPGWAAVGENNQDAFGSWTTGVGDVNGDGFADVVVQANVYSVYRGKIYLFPGNQGRGRQLLPRQGRATTGFQTVQPWGSAPDQSAFLVRMVANLALGRSRVKLQVQACPTGVAFGDAACLSFTSPAWIDNAVPGGGVLFEETIAGLAPFTLYRWRARILYAPLWVIAPGVSAPPNPPHGPWRRMYGQAFEADLRTGPALLFLPAVMQ